MFPIIPTLSASQFIAMAAPSRERINEDGVRKATNALLKWKKKSLLSHPHDGNAANEEEADDFIYLSVTLKKVPPRNLSAVPHRILLRRSLLSQDYTASNICLIVDGKRITAESAQKLLLAKGIPFVKKVFKLGKLKSDYDSFESKKKLFDSFDLFLADKSVEAMLPKVLGRVFYKKRKKIPVAVDLRGDWKEELERACRSSLWCLSSGTCSSVRVGRLGEMESGEIVENVLDAVDGVVGIVPRKWGGIRCLHLKLSDSLALPIYEDEVSVSVSDGKVGSSLMKRK